MISAFSIGSYSNTETFAPTHKLLFYCTGEPWNIWQSSTTLSKSGGHTNTKTRSPGAADLIRPPSGCTDFNLLSIPVILVSCCPNVSPCCANVSVSWLPAVTSMAIAASIRKKLLFIFINLGKILYKYKAITEHKRLLKEFKDKPMIVTYEEAIKDEVVAVLY
jgi:hypothetical protein